MKPKEKARAKGWISPSPSDMCAGKFLRTIATVWMLLMAGIHAVQGQSSDLVVGSNSSNQTTGFSSGANGYSNIWVGYNVGDSNNLLIISNTNTVLTNSGDLTIGYGGSDNRMTISGGAIVADGNGWIGSQSTALNNSVLVSDDGTLWANVMDLIVGADGSGNSLTISNGAAVSVQGSSYGTVIGLNADSSNNSALVTGINASGNLSTLTNGMDLTVGYGGADNHLIINGGAQVFDNNGWIGYLDTASMCSVMVSDAGTLWSNGMDLTVGTDGSGNKLTISNGATVSVQGSVYGMVVGLYSYSSNNSVLVTGVNANGNPSTLTNGMDLVVGADGSGNSLTISNGGTVNVQGSSYGTVVGLYSSNNSVLVTGVNANGKPSTLTNGMDLTVGADGSVNKLTISNGATVSVQGNDYGTVVGLNADSSNNSVLVTGVNANGNPSMLTNSMDLYIGVDGSCNSLTVSNGAIVLVQGYNMGTVLGLNFDSYNNSILVTGVNARGLPSTLSNGMDLTVGYSGTGNSLTISAGAVVTDVNSWIGSQSTALNNSVLVDGSGSIWSNSGELYVGLEGSGNSLVISNGGTVAVGNSYVGNGDASSNNSVLVDGSGSFWNHGGDLYVGIHGSGNSLVISNGGTVAVGNALVGMYDTASNNSVLVTGAGSLWTNSRDAQCRIGDGGSGNSLVISNGGTVADDLGWIGFSGISSNNSVLVTGGNSLWTNRFDLYVSYYGASNTLTVADGGTVGASSIRLADQAGSSGTLNIGRYGTNDAAGTITAPTIAFGSGTGAINFNQSDSITMSADISGAGTVNQLGTGTTTLSGSNTYNGTTTIDGGRLVVTGSISNSSELLVGAHGSGNSLVISNGGAVVVVAAIIGYNESSSNNSVLVTGTNSLWTNIYGFDVGCSGSGNSLVISNGGKVATGYGATIIGYNESSSNNSVLVTGTNSLLNSAQLSIGIYGNGNSLIISNGGKVATTYGALGNSMRSFNNSVLVTGPGSLWTNSDDLYVGAYYSSGNTLTVSDGGTVTAPSIRLADLGSSGTLNFGRYGTNDTAGTIAAPAIAFGAGTGTINFNQSDSTSISADISGAGTVNQLGAGTTTLSGSSSYTGTTLISNGTLQTASASALGTSAVQLDEGTLAPVGVLNIQSLVWNGGTIGSRLGTNTSFVGIATDFMLNPGGGCFAFTGDSGFAPNTSYSILGGTNWDSMALTNFRGNTLLGLNPIFTINGTNLLVNFEGATSGAILQNSSNVYTPLDANFLVSNSVSTGMADESNTVAALTFAGASTLKVYNTLNVTNGGFTVESGVATVTGGTLVAPGDVNKLGAGSLALLGSAQIGRDAVIDAGALLVKGTVNAAGDLYVGKTNSNIAMVVSNSGTVADADAYVGYDAASTNNSVLVTGGSSLWSNGGTLTIGDAGSGTLTVANGGSVSTAVGIMIAAQSGSTGTLNIASLGGSNTGGTIITPLISLGAGSGILNFNQVNTATIAAAISDSGNGAINQLGSGTTILNGKNSGFSGLTTILGGTLQIGDGVTTGGAVSTGNFLNNTTMNLVPSSIDTYMVPGAISGTGNVKMLGSGTLNITGVNTYTGTTILDGGMTIVTGSINSTSDFIVGNTSSGISMVMSNGGTVANNNGYIGSYAASSNNSVLVTGGSSFWSNGGTLTIGNAGSGTLTIANGGIVSAASGITIASQAGTVSALNIGSLGGSDSEGTIITPAISFRAGSGVLNFNQVNTTTIAAAISDSGNGAMNQLGSGTTILNGKNSGFSGLTTILGGALQIGDGVSTGGAVSAGNFLNYATLNLVPSSSDTYTVVGTIFGTGNVNMLGSGTLTITGANTYRGTTLLEGGMTIISGSIYSGSDFIVGNASSGISMVISNGGTVANNSGWIGNTATASNNSVLVTGANSLWNNSSSLIIGNAGRGSLTVAHEGVVTASNTIYIASQAGSVGALNVGSLGGSDSAGTIITPAISFREGSGALNFNQVNTATIAAAISDSGNGAINQFGSGTSILTGNNRGFSGPTTISHGTLQIGNGVAAAVGVSSGNFVNNSSLVFAPSISSDYALSITGNISGAGTLSQIGTGTIVLTGSNSYSGTTFINSGTLISASTNALGVGTVTLGGGSNTSNLELYSDLTISSLKWSSNSVINLVPGLQTLTINGAFINNNIATDNFDFNGLSINGSYTIINFASAMGFTTNSFSVTDSIGWTFSLNTTSLVATYTSTESGGGGGGGHKHRGGPPPVPAFFPPELPPLAPIPTPPFGMSNFIALSPLILTAETVGTNAVIIGGATNIIVRATNSNNDDGIYLSVLSNSLNHSVTGSISPKVDVGAKTSTNITGLAFTGTTIGSNQVGTFTPIEVPRQYSQSLLDKASTDTQVRSNAYTWFYLATDPVDPTLSVNVYDHAAGSLLTTNVVLQPIHVGYTNQQTSSLVISNASGYRVDLQTVSSSTNSNVVMGNISSLSSGSSITENVMLLPGQGTGAFNYVVNVVFGDSSTLNGANSNLSTIDLTVSGNVFSYAEGAVLGSPTITYTNGVASNVINLGNIHEGGFFGTTNLMVSNSASGAAGYVEALAGSFTGSNNVTVEGAFSGLTGRTNATISISLGSAHSGNNTGSVGVVFTSQTNALETGLLNTVLGTNTVSVSGFVYTGQSTWTAASGAWTSFANWNSLGGTPGLDGMLSINDSATFGLAGSGTVTFDTNAALNTLNLSNASSAFTLEGSGTLALVQGSNAPVINNLAGTNVISAALHFASNVTIISAAESKITVAGNISGPGGLTKSGYGTAVLAETVSYTGGSRVNGGTLLVNGTNQNSAMSVGSSATLGGIGLIGGPVTIFSGGNLKAGFGGTGSLSLTAGLTLSSGSTTTFFINSTNRFTSINLIGGSVNYGGGLVFNITNYLPSAGDAFTVFNMTGAATQSGNFSSIEIGSYLLTDVGGIWSVTVDGMIYGFSGSTGQLSVTTAVPEPSTYALFGIGAIGMLMVLRRRKSA